MKATSGRSNPPAPYSFIGVAHARGSHAFAANAAAERRACSAFSKIVRAAERQAGGATSRLARRRMERALHWCRIRERRCANCSAFWEGSSPVSFAEELAKRPRTEGGGRGGPDGGPTGLRRGSDGHPTGLRRGSDGTPTGLRRCSDGAPTGLRRAPTGLRRGSDGAPTGLRQILGIGFN